MSSEREELILEVLRKSERALNCLEIVKQLPRPFQVKESDAQELLNVLQERGSIFVWGESRKRTLYGAVSLPEKARAAVLSLLRDSLTPEVLKKKSQSKLKGCPAKDALKVINQTLKDLLQEGAIVKTPRSGEKYSLPNRSMSFADALSQLQSQFTDMTPDAIREAVLQVMLPSTPLRERILKAIELVEPRVHEGGVASITEVRRRLSPPIPKKEFDSALLQLGRDGVLSIHQFYGHLQIGEDQREELVFDEKETYYGGVTFQRR